MYGVATSPPLVIKAQPAQPVQVAARERSPPSSPSVSSPGRRPSRSRQPSRPKKIDVRELEDRFKELQVQRKKDEGEQRELERQQKRDSTNYHQTLLRQQRVAERDVLRREVEVDRLEKGLHKVRRDMQIKGEKQTDAVAKIEDTMNRLMSRQHDIERQLEEKVKEAALSKGKLAHIEFANSLLHQSQVAVPLIKDFEDDDTIREPSGILSLLSPEQEREREQTLLKEAEELRTANRRRAGENARLRKELQEAGAPVEALLRAMRAPSPAEIAAAPKPLFACVGGELGGGTFYNLWDEGFDSNLGPGFSFSARVRYDKCRRCSKVFDFGSGDSMDNIYVGNKDDTNTLVFGSYQGQAGTVLTMRDFWVMEEAHDYLFVVTPQGQMKVYRDGNLVGSKQGQSLRITERRNLYVGRSNWPPDAPFEGSVSNIKVWDREVDWSSIERCLRESLAESWALGHAPPPATASSCTYMGGVTLHFQEFSSALAALKISNACHRKRMLEEIEAGNHTRVAASVYQSQGWDMEGYLLWRSGEVCEFIKLVFQEFSLVPPNESSLFPLFSKFSPGWSNELSALDCFCLFDAVLRGVFYKEAMLMHREDNIIDSEVQTQAATISGQPSGASTRRMYGSVDASSRSLWSQNVSVVSGIADSSFGGGSSVGRSYSMSAVPASLSVGAGLASPSRSRGPVARTPSPVARVPVMVRPASTATPMVVPGTDAVYQKVSHARDGPLPQATTPLRQAPAVASTTPVAVLGVDTNHDGRANIVYVGADRNRDGIPDALQAPAAVQTVHNAIGFAQPQLQPEIVAPSLFQAHPLQTYVHRGQSRGFANMSEAMSASTLVAANA